MLFRVAASPARSPTSGRGEGLLVVVQGLLVVAQPGVHEADVVQGGGFAGAVADLPQGGRACW